LNGLISILPPFLCEEIFCFWNQLSERFSVERVKLTGTPHITWNYAEHYCLDDPQVFCKTLARRLQPLRCRTNGLGPAGTLHRRDDEHGDGGLSPADMGCSQSCRRSAQQAISPRSLDSSYYLGHGRPDIGEYRSDHCFPLGVQVEVYLQYPKPIVGDPFPRREHAN